MESYPLTQPSCAARDLAGRPCDATPVVPCPKCLLVAYCDNVCRVRHWLDHKPDCKRSYYSEALQDLLTGEQDMQSYFTFWSNYAAIDLLNLEKNEGRFFDGDLSIFLAGQSSFRHFIYSLVKIPKTATPSLRLTINFHNPVHLCRDFFAVHLLLDQRHDPYLNAEATIHLWYSSMLPSALWRHVFVVMKEYFDDFEECLETAKEEQKTEICDPDEPDRKCKMRWAREDISFSGNLFESHWCLIKDVLITTKQMTAEQAAIVRALDLTKSCEPLKLAASRMTQSRTAGMMKWRRDGMLLPFGHPMDAFDMFNPIFYRGNGSFPPGAAAEPIGEWPMEFLDFSDCPAQNDVYGKLFYYLRDMLVRFQEESKRFRIRVSFTSKDMSSLLYRLDETDLYDRIHMGDLWDYHPACNLAVAAGCLQHIDQNPFATMLAISRLSVTSGDKELEEELCEEGYKTFEPCGAVLDEFAPPIDEEKGCKMETVLRRRIGLLMWRNWEKFSERFIHNAKLFGFYLSLECETERSSSVFKTGFLGMQFKQRNTITRRWPNRLVHNKNDKPSLRDFNRHVGWFDVMPQRWMEWKRVDDADDDDWEMSRECVLEDSWLAMSHFQATTLEKAKEEDELAKCAKKPDTETGGDAAAQKALNRRIEELVRDEADAREKSGKSGTAKTKGKSSKRKKGKKK